MKVLLSKPMIQGNQVWLREMDKRDLESFVSNRNNLGIGFVAGFYYPQNMNALEKWYDVRMGDQHGIDGFYITICLIGSDDPVGFAWLW